MDRSNKRSVALLWDESFLWGLMAFKALKAAGLPFQLIRSGDIKAGCLDRFAALFVPGGWASNKLKALGDDGVAAIRDFVGSGGSYVGFCGGAGLATSDGIGLVDITRKPTPDRVPSFSGCIRLSVKEHKVWNDVSNPVFNAWWPSQFVVNDAEVNVIAAYDIALDSSFSSDLNVKDISSSGTWDEMESAYGINLDPARLIGEPAVIEGKYGDGKVVLSLIHFDTPDDRNGAQVLKNIWEYIGIDAHPLKSIERDCVSNGVSAYSAKNIAYDCGPKDESGGNKSGGNNAIVESYDDTNPDSLEPVLNDLAVAASDLIDLGIRNFLWFWRNPMLLQWRRGVRGLEFCTLKVMVDEIAAMMRDEKVTPASIETEHFKGARTDLRRFSGEARHLLIKERFAIQNGNISYRKCDDPQLQMLRMELFGEAKSHGGLFKITADRLDDILFNLLKDRQFDAPVK